MKKKKEKQTPSLLTKDGYGINKPKPRPKLNELGYPVDDPYGLIEAFTRVGPKKI
jgi:hypothetical protein